jgi:hypothetical protein
MFHEIRRHVFTDNWKDYGLFTYEKVDIYPDKLKF